MSQAFGSGQIVDGGLKTTKQFSDCCSLAAGLLVLLSSGEAEACSFKWSLRLLVVEPLYRKCFRHNLQRATVLPCAFTYLVKCTQHFAREVRAGNAGLFAAGSMSNLHEQDKDAPWTVESSCSGCVRVRCSCVTRAQEYYAIL